MKKLLVLLVALSLTLCGCGKEELASKTCTLTEDNGAEITYKMNATNDVIDSFDMTYVMTPEALGVASQGITSLNSLDDATKEQVKDNFITALGLESDTYEGLEIDVTFTDDMIVTVKADINAADKDILSKLGFEITDEKMSLKKSVEEMTEEGYTCK